MGKSLVGSFALGVLVTAAIFSSISIYKNETPLENTFGRKVYGVRYSCQIESVTPYKFDLNNEIRRMESGFDAELLTGKIKQHEGEFKVIYNDRFEINMRCKKRSATI